MKTMKTLLLVGSAVLAMAAAPALAQTQNSAAKSTKKAATDQAFVMNAARGSMAEVDLGKLAADKASSQQVKDYGQRMVDDHGKANDELKTLAQTKNITLPTDLSAKDKAQHARLSNLSGAAFDRAYMQATITNHRTDVNEFRQASKMGKDADIKAFASKTLPTLQDHLKMAQTTDKAVVGTSGTVKKAKAKS
jgi:putative membrane protein